MRHLPFALLLVALLPWTALANDNRTAQEILDSMLDTEALGFQSGEVTMTLLVADRSGQARERQLQVQGQRSDDRFQAVVRVLRPAEVAGQAYLFRENPGGQDDVFAYLPAIDEAPRRIAGSQRNASFMGTNFTYADLQRRDWEGASSRRLPDETIGRFPVYVIEITPTASANVDYSRAIAWVRQSDNIPLRVRYFDRDNNEARTLFTERTDTHNDRIYIRRMTLRAADGTATTMVIDSIDDTVRFDSATFTPAALAN